MKFRKTRISILTLVMFVVAGAMFAFGALNFGLSPYITSDDLESDFELDHIGVNLLENGKPVATDETTGSKQLLAGKGNLIPGKKYDEKIAAYNSERDVDQFVRIIVRKYWMSPDEAGNYVKDASLDTTLIKLTYDGKDIFKEGFKAGKWQINNDELTDETATFYYTSVLNPGTETDPLTDKLQISSVIASKSLVSDDYVTRDDKPGTDGQTIITYTYKYDGKVICIEAEAQALQPHNINDAIKSVWGVQNVSVSGDTLSVE